MKLRAILCCLALLAAPLAFGQETTAQIDIRNAALPEAYLAMHGMYNPERDYQRVYLAEVWQTVQKEKIGERLLKIVTSRMPPEKLSHAESVLEEIQAAMDPEFVQAIGSSEEIVYIQVMQFPSNQHLAVLRYKPGVAEKIETSCQNLLALLSKKTEGKVPVSTVMQGEVEITSLGFPKEVPFQPTFARLGDVFLISSSPTLLGQGLERLQSGASGSKFDDPRFAEAISKLPKAEDGLTIFDGQQLFKQLRGIGEMIRTQGKDNSHALRVADTFDIVIDEFAVLDYEVTVEYTDGNENRAAVFGKTADDAKDKAVYKALSGGEAFVDWQKWIPADAIAYSLSKGIQLHPLYERTIEILETKFPESKEPLARFAKLQQDFDLHLDRDIFQSFSGECVSITLQRSEDKQDSVFALKCTNSGRIRELLHRLVDNVAKIPAVAGQQISLTEVESLPGFESLNLATLTAFNVKPVIGFHDGWLMVGSTPEAIQTVLDTRIGKSPSIDSSEHFERFHLPIEGAVGSLAYTDIEKNIHNAADLIRNIGGIAPMFLAMAGANANAEELKPVMEALAILPSIANVVEKFDYYQANLSVIQTGSSPNTYMKQSVTLLRPPVVAAK